MLKGSYTVREADDIANLAFIGGKTNRQISDKTPNEYFPAVIKKGGTAAFESQCIPTDDTLLGADAYKKFLAVRRVMVSQRLNSFLEVADAQRTERAPHGNLPPTGNIAASA